MSEEERQRKELTRRARIDSNFEQTPMRIAFQAWRNARWSISGNFWDVWDERSIGSGIYWEAFKAGWDSSRERGA